MSAQRKKIAIIGNGLAGLQSLDAIVQEFEASGKPADIQWIGENPVFGPGFPYATQLHDALTLNVPAGEHFVHSNWPNEFTDWLAATKTPAEIATPRRRFGQFLVHHVPKTMQVNKQGPLVHVGQVTGKVEAIQKYNDQYLVTTNTGSAEAFDHIVLAVGHPLRPDAQFDHLKTAPYFLSMPYFIPEATRQELRHLLEQDDVNIALGGQGAGALDAIHLWRAVAAEMGCDADKLKFTIVSRGAKHDNFKHKPQGLLNADRRWEHIIKGYEIPKHIQRTASCSVRQQDKELLDHMNETGQLRYVNDTIDYGTIKLSGSASAPFKGPQWAGNMQFIVSSTPFSRAHYVAQEDRMVLPLLEQMHRDGLISGNKQNGLLNVSQDLFALNADGERENIQINGSLASPLYGVGTFAKIAKHNAERLVL